MQLANIEKLSELILLNITALYFADLWCSGEQSIAYIQLSKKTILCYSHGNLI